MEAESDLDYNSLKELYDTVSDPDSASYRAFMAKIARLRTGNVRTLNRVKREFGILPESARTARRNGRKPQPSNFVAYDGEGWSDKYVLLANSLGERIVNKEGLSTEDCLEFLNLRYDKPVKRVFFSFSYDVNHIIKDFTDGQIEVLLRGRSVDYKGYRVSYIPGKIFIVNGLRYYDVFSFFATSFLRVVEKMLGKEYLNQDLIEGKANRGLFETWDLDRLIHYNDIELDLMVKIMDRLREAFTTIGVSLNEWYGPGAVAKYWFKTNNILPEEKHTVGSIEALNSAYYGGRFEQLTLGKVKNVWEYDIHSAYPSVMVEMPYFKTWKRVSGKQFVDNEYSIWYVSFDLRKDWYLHQSVTDKVKAPQFGPLPIRDRAGRICYPLVGKGWYWYNEVKVMLDYFPEAKVVFHAGYVATTEGKPFSWITDLYEYRRTLKDTGDLSQYAIKVGLNSLYGKCAQRVGNNPYFSLSWAGYITSTTRAKLARVAYENGSHHILGFATDAIFSDCQLRCPISDSIGDWEELSYASAIFFQSGIYRLVRADGSEEDRYRGSPLRRGIDDIIDQLTRYPNRYPKVRIGRFISHMLAIKAPKAYGKYRTKFVQVVMEIKIDAPYKRHYEGFGYGNFDAIGNQKRNYARLLRQPIISTPKVFVNDNHWQLSDEYMFKHLKMDTIESEAPPMKDGNTQRLLEEASLEAVMEGFTESSKLDELPVLEDEMM